MNLSYYDDNTLLEAFVAAPNKERRPLVLLCHAWAGRDAFICEKAEAVAKKGYVGFALDMYGKGVLGHSKEENGQLKKPFLERRDLLQKRVLKAFEVASALPYVDKGRIAAVGYGFGAICALDLARAGAPLKGVVSIYGHFDSPQSIQTKVLILHGAEDTVTTQEELQKFQNELKTNWQTHLYAHTKHAFASPNSETYNPVAESRSWRYFRLFGGDFSITKLIFLDLVIEN